MTLNREEMERNSMEIKRTAYDLKNAGIIHENCSVCGLKYEKEIGFYYGAMYVSYAFQVALFVTLWTSFNLFIPSATIGVQITVILLATLLFSPYLYALSKITWINFFIAYDENARTKN
jgi:hypothetical protein